MEEMNITYKRYRSLAKSVSTHVSKDRTEEYHFRLTSLPVEKFLLKKISLTIDIGQLQNLPNPSP